MQQRNNVGFVGHTWTYGIALGWLLIPVPIREAREARNAVDTRSIRTKIRDIRKVSDARYERCTKWLGAWKNIFSHNFVYIKF